MHQVLTRFSVFITPAFFFWASPWSGFQESWAVSRLLNGQGESSLEWSLTPCRHPDVEYRAAFSLSSNTVCALAHLTDDRCDSADSRTQSNCTSCFRAQHPQSLHSELKLLFKIIIMLFCLKFNRATRLHFIISTRNPTLKLSCLSISLNVCSARSL